MGSACPGNPLAAVRQVGCKGMKRSEIVAVNAPIRSDALPRLEDYPYRLSDNVRFADLDPNGHVNNAVYATYFETGRVTLVKDPSYGLMPPELGWTWCASTFISAPSCTGPVESNWVLAS